MASSFISRIKKLASETAIYGISSILARMVNFALFPLYLNVLPTDEWGIVSKVFVLFAFLNIVFQYGMESAYLKYASVSEEAERKKTTFSTAFWSLLGSSLVLALALMFLFRDAVGVALEVREQWRFLFYYAGGILLLDALLVVPFAELRLQSQPWRFAFVRLTGVLVNVGLNLYLLLAAGWGLEAIFFANLVASGTQLLLLAPTLGKELRLRFDGQLWRQLMLFGLPFVPGGLGYVVTEKVNIFFLNEVPPDRIHAMYDGVFDLSEVARRAAAAAEAAGDPAAANAVYSDYLVGVFYGVLKLAVLMALVVQMFRYAWQPFFLQHAKDADAPRLFARIFTLFTAGAAFVVLGVSFFMHELVAFPLPGGRYLIPPSYWPALFVVPIALVGYVFQGWYYNFAAGAYLENQTKYFIHCTLAGSVLALVLNAVFVPQYGMVAAAWATTLAYVLMAVLLHVIIQRHYPIPYEWGSVLRALLLAGGLFALWTTLPALQVWWIEALLLLGYLVGLVALRVVPLASLRRMAG